MTPAQPIGPELAVIGAVALVGTLVVSVVTFKYPFLDRFCRRVPFLRGLARDESRPRPWTDYIGTGMMFAFSIAMIVAGLAAI